MIFELVISGGGYRPKKKKKKKRLLDELSEKTVLHIM
jgi:hypothetical protein